MLSQDLGIETMLQQGDEAAQREAVPVETPTGAAVPNPEGIVWGHLENADLDILSVNDGIVDGGIKARKKVAIVGFATSTRDLAPFRDPSYEIWGLNQLYRHIPRADRWFDIHVNYDEHVVEGTDHVAWLRNCKIPVYMNQAWPEYPTSVKYPVEYLIQKYKVDYFTSTIAFMLALAIDSGFSQIDVYGVDLIVGTEWEDQRQCAEYWIGLARGKGIEVYIPPASALLTQAFRYGYDPGPNYIVTNEDIAKRQARVKQRRDQLQINLALLDGALQEDEHWFKELSSLDPASKKRLQERAHQVRAKRDEIQIQLAMLDGAWQEDMYWAQLVQLRIRGGTVKSSE